MGTRNLTAVILNGERKIAQYGQWDGYPTGQGQNIVAFIIDKLLVEGLMKEFKQAVSECYWMTDEQYKAEWLKAGANPESEWVNMEVSNKMDAMNPQLSRDVGGSILEMVLNGARALRDRWDFAQDGLFCEWAYVVDLDNEILEVYEGFKKAKALQNDRFNNDETSPDKEGYWPVQKIRQYKFSELAGDTMKKLEEENTSEVDE